MQGRRAKMARLPARQRGQGRLGKGQQLKLRLCRRQERRLLLRSRLRAGRDAHAALQEAQRGKHAVQLLGAGLASLTECQGSLMALHDLSHSLLQRLLLKTLHPVRLTSISLPRATSGCRDSLCGRHLPKTCKEVASLRWPLLATKFCTLASRRVEGMPAGGWCGAGQAAWRLH